MSTGKWRVGESVRYKFTMKLVSEREAPILVYVQTV